MTQGGCARVQMEQMTWTEIRALLDKGVRTVIIPTGSMEQHGYHLSENTDSVLGEHIAAAVARALGDALVAPVLRPGLSEHHMAMAGTLTLRPETFRMLLEDYIDSYSRHGFNTIIIIAFHGGNVQPTAELLQPLRQRRPECACSIFPRCRHRTCCGRKWPRSVCLTASTAGMPMTAKHRRCCI